MRCDDEPVRTRLRSRQAPQRRAHRRPRPRPRAGDAEGASASPTTTSRKPLVGVATTWIETMPCNLNQRALAQHVKAGIRDGRRDADRVQHDLRLRRRLDGHRGMRASLVSREVIADSIELVARGHLFDGLVCLVGCDKTIPAAVMALGRLDLPGLVLYNGSIAPGQFRGRDVTIQDVFEAVGAHAAGTMTRRGAARARVASRARAPAPAAASSPRTRWRPRSSSSGSAPAG